ncbi:MAG: SH3 domain-containing protein [Nannocystaceae bacterium]
MRTRDLVAAGVGVALLGGLGLALMSFLGEPGGGGSGIGWGGGGSGGPGVGGSGSGGTGTGGGGGGDQGGGNQGGGGQTPNNGGNGGNGGGGNGGGGNGGGGGGGGDGTCSKVKVNEGKGLPVVYVRAEPRAKAAIVTTAAPGQVLEVDGAVVAEGGVWYRVRGLVAWISAANVTCVAKGGGGKGGKTDGGCTRVRVRDDVPIAYVLPEPKKGATPLYPVSAGATLDIGDAKVADGLVWYQLAEGNAWISAADVVCVTVKEPGKGGGGGQGGDQPNDGGDQQGDGGDQDQGDQGGQGQGGGDGGDQADDDQGGQGGGDDNQDQGQIAKPDCNLPPYDSDEGQELLSAVLDECEIIRAETRPDIVGEAAALEYDTGLPFPLDRWRPPEEGTQNDRAVNWLMWAASVAVYRAGVKFDPQVGCTFGDDWQAAAPDLLQALGANG